MQISNIITTICFLISKNCKTPQMVSMALAIRSRSHMTLPVLKSRDSLPVRLCAKIIEKLWEPTITYGKSTPQLWRYGSIDWLKSLTKTTKNWKKIQPSQIGKPQEHISTLMASRFSLPTPSSWTNLMINSSVGLNFPTSESIIWTFPLPF